MYWAETKIAMILASKSECSYIYDVNIDLDYDEFADEQVEAIESAFKNMFLVITGGPGTGKTTIIKTITKILEDNNLTYSLVAPTGRAAKRMNESTGKPTSTIHRLIGLMPGAKSSKKYNENEPIPSNYIIVDEVSMVDTMLMKMLLMAISSNTVLILVGDSNQLPSVGPGNVLRDVINTNVKTVELKKIFRQSEESDIVINAHKINNGIYPVLNREDKGFYFVECDKDNFDETMLELIDKRLPEFYDIDKINDIQVLCPSKKSAFGTVELNKQLQNRLNPLSEDEEEKQLWDFRLNDKVMQTRNNYDIKVYNTEDRKTGVFNGDIGTVKSIDSEDELLTVEFEDGATVVYDALDAQNLELSYAITIHKSQGSEFKCVVIPVMPVAYMLLNRNLFYTAVTRAKENVVLVGDKNIIKKMVNNNTSSKRLTHLDYLLSGMI